jgi:hypothetical protein
MICAFILEVVGAGEAGLVTHPFAGACRTVVPILDIDSIGETKVLIRPLFYHIGATRILLLGGMDASSDVGNHLISTCKGDWCSGLHGITCVETSMSIAGAAATTTASSTRLTPLMCRG